MENFEERYKARTEGKEALRKEAASFILEDYKMEQYILTRRTDPDMVCRCCPSPCRGRYCDSSAGSRTSILNSRRSFDMLKNKHTFQISKTVIM